MRSHTNYLTERVSKVGFTNFFRNGPLPEASGYEASGY
jgi:hypothetical protein